MTHLGHRYASGHPAAWASRSEAEGLSIFGQTVFERTINADLPAFVKAQAASRAAA
jgi:hypothetical protein